MPFVRVIFVHRYTSGLSTTLQDSVACESMLSHIVLNLYFNAILLGYSPGSYLN